MFTNVDNVRDTKVASTEATDYMAARLNASETGRTIGTAMMLNVMAGDKFDVTAQSFWNTNDAGNLPDNSSLLTALVSTLVSGANANSAIGEQGATQVINSTITSDNYAAFQSILNTMTDPDAPTAYINYMMFDDQMNFLPDQSGAVQIGSTSGTWQAIGTTSPISATHTGYVLIFMSTTYLGDVYFDNLQITVYHSRLLQEQHYYPFGLAVNVGEAVGGDNVHNKFKFEGNEVTEDLSLNLQDFHARMYNYQIGRFTGIDKLADAYGQVSLTPYHFCADDPANGTDPTGLFDGEIGNRNKTLSDDQGYNLEVIDGDDNLAWDGGSRAMYGDGNGSFSSAESEVNLTNELIALNSGKVNNSVPDATTTGIASAGPVTPGSIGPDNGEQTVTIVNDNTNNHGSDCTTDDDQGTNGSSNSNNPPKAGFTNNSISDVYWVKPEDNFQLSADGSLKNVGNSTDNVFIWASSAYPVFPGQTTPYAIDGFAKEGGGEVFKVISIFNTGVSVDADNNIHGVWMIINSIGGGGWKGQSTLDNLNANKNTSWNQLFNQAGYNLPTQ